MSRHKECGATIRWARRDDNPDRWAPPLEFAGHGYVFLESSDVAVQTSIYKPHDCDPNQVIAWHEYLARMEEIKAEHGDTTQLTTVYTAARDMERLERLELAQKVKCPTCQIKKGHPCYNLTVYKREGKKVDTREPHASRLLAAEKTSSNKSE